MCGSCSFLKSTPLERMLIASIDLLDYIGESEYLVSVLVMDILSIRVSRSLPLIFFSSVT